MKRRTLLFRITPFSLFFLFFTGGSVSHRSPGKDPEALYERLETKEEHSLPPRDLFLLGWQGYRKATEKDELEKKRLTLIDFRLSSNEERLWTIDPDEEKILHQTLVAHGKGSGNEYARQFSNEPGSHQSSLGFYSTGKTYHGKHGLSLKLDGLEEGFNDKARERAIVMHAADYVSPDFAREHGRIGRSFGCPAVPEGHQKELFPHIKEGSCLFIFFPEADYLESSEYLEGE